MEPRLRAAQTWLSRNASVLTSVILLLVAAMVIVAGVVRL